MAPMCQYLAPTCDVQRLQRARPLSPAQLEADPMPTWTGCWGQPGGSGAKRVRISWICALVVGGWPWPDGHRTCVRRASLWSPSVTLETSSTQCRPVAGDFAEEVDL